MADLAHEMASYLLIAATYTPFLALMKSGLAFAGLSIGIWSSALVGVFLKLALPGRFDRLSIALYLLLGWSGVIAYGYFAPAIPNSSLWLLAISGIFYSLGTIFHLWEQLRFQNAIWHGFVLIAASCHYSAVLPVWQGDDIPARSAVIRQYPIVPTRARG